MNFIDERKSAAFNVMQSRTRGLSLKRKDQYQMEIDRVIKANEQLMEQVVILARQRDDAVRAYRALVGGGE